MLDKVRIKSYAKGLIVRLDAESPFETILEEVTAKFTDGRSFFGDASVAVQFEGRELSEEQEDEILLAIRRSCDLKITCILDRDEKLENTFAKATQFMERQKLCEAALGEEIQVFRGSLTDGEKLDTPSNIILLGDVESGCVITSERSIIILGNLYGEAHAGYGRPEEDAFVCAFEMAPEELTIGDFKYEPPKKGLWGRKKKEQVMLAATVLDDKIQVEEVTREILSRM